MFSNSTTSNSVTVTGTILHAVSSSAAEWRVLGCRRLARFYFRSLLSLPWRPQRRGVRPLPPLPARLQTENKISHFTKTFARCSRAHPFARTLRAFRTDASFRYLFQRVKRSRRVHPIARILRGNSTVITGTRARDLAATTRGRVLGRVYHRQPSIAVGRRLLFEPRRRQGPRLRYGGGHGPRADARGGKLRRGKWQWRWRRRQEAPQTQPTSQPATRSVAARLGGTLPTPRRRRWLPRRPRRRWSLQLCRNRVSYALIFCMWQAVDNDKTRLH